MKKIRTISLFVLFFLNNCHTDGLEVNLSIKEHRFTPDVLEVPANTKLILIVHNEDNIAEEFESFDLKRERIIPPNTSIRIPIAPLKKGEYSFFGEFHPETCQGKIIAIDEEIKKIND